MTPKYNPKKQGNGYGVYYHTTGESWHTDVNYPNPAKVADPATRQKRQDRQPKRKVVLRRGRMSKLEKRILTILFLLALLKIAFS